ncbi:MAG: phage tail protein [Candidatus Paraimprobicoccus trichonymphae]|uniref:Phage tail protein n=1 Tax=Candidatus Paraimprobicoccus trichonymphae TaxID=3033793 RepID=A0AA48IAA1_9FIRM|nr:MAG: phage tail protein [Candidatus Paraimprobicoccus trichonymphae]
MASGSNTFGGTIKLEGEKEYRDALKQINSDLRVLGSEMTKATAEFDRNDKSVEGLSKKNEVLNNQIDKQKDKVSTLKEALKSSSEEYGENDKKTQGWQISLNKAEADLIKMEKELGNNEKALDEAGKATDENSESLDEFSKSEVEAGKQTLTLGDLIKANLISDAIISGIKAIGSAIVDMANNMKECIVSAAAYGDNIQAMSVKTGVSTQALQEYSAISELVDVDLNTMTNSMSKQIKSMSDASNGSKNMVDAYNKLGVSVTDSNGSLRDSEQVYWETIDALGSMQNETERDALAMQILGKSAQELKPLIAQGSSGIAELTQKAYEMGAVLSEDALKSLGAMDDSMKIWGKTLSSTSNLIGATFAPAITEIISGANGVMGAFNGIIASILNGGDVDKAINTFVSSIQELIPRIMEIVPKLLETGVQLIDALLKGITTALPDLLDVAVTVITSLISGIINALPAIAEAAIEIILALVSGLSGALPTLIPAIINVVLTIAQALIDNIDVIFEAAVSFFMGIVEAIPELIKVLIPKIPQIVISFVNELVGNMPILIQGAIQLLMGIIEAIPVIVQEIIKNFPAIINAIMLIFFTLPTLLFGVFQNIISDMLSWGKDSEKTGESGATSFLNSVVDIIKNLPSKIFGFLSDVIGKIGTFFRDIISTGGSKSAEFLKSIIDKIKNLPQDIWNGIIGAVEKVQKWGTELGGKAKDAAGEIWNNIVNGIKGLPDKMWSIGEDLVKGLWNGIKNVKDWIMGKISGFVSTITDGIKGFFGISSPSKVMRDQVGKNLALGIGEGFSDEMKAVTEEMQDSLPHAFDFDTAINPEFSKLSSETSVNNSDYIVTAFQNALAGMSFMIDGDKMGELVINQVERVVYS